MTEKPDLYLDIDGVLLLGWDEDNKRIENTWLVDMLLATKDRYNRIFWLSCWTGGGLTERLYREHPRFKEFGAIDLKWGMTKTSAIDWSHSFLWIDDGPMPEEMKEYREQAKEGQDLWRIVLGICEQNFRASGATERDDDPELLSQDSTDWYLKDPRHPEALAKRELGIARELDPEAVAMFIEHLTGEPQPFDVIHGHRFSALDLAPDAAKGLKRAERLVITETNNVTAEKEDSHWIIDKLQVNGVESVTLELIEATDDPAAEKEAWKKLQAVRYDRNDPDKYKRTFDAWHRWRKSNGHCICHHTEPIRPKE